MRAAERYSPAITAIPKPDTLRLSFGSTVAEI